MIRYTKNLNKSKLFVLLLITTFAICGSTYSQSVLGKWVTKDDETGMNKSVIEIYTKPNSKLYGRVLQVFSPPAKSTDLSCTLCEDDRKNQKVIGMEILRGLEQKGSYWANGSICDPKNGKIYACKIWIEKESPNKLFVRGYTAFLFRTQEWSRINP